MYFNTYLENNDVKLLIIGNNPWKINDDRINKVVIHRYNDIRKYIDDNLEFIIKINKYNNIIIKYNWDFITINHPELDNILICYNNSKILKNLYDDRILLEGHKQLIKNTFNQGNYYYMHGENVFFLNILSSNGIYLQEYDNTIINKVIVYDGLYNDKFNDQIKKMTNCSNIEYRFIFNKKSKLYMYMEKLDTNWKYHIDQYELNTISNSIDISNSLVYPSEYDIFNAFNYFNVEDTKCVILGQDPYYKEGQANGLAFSVNKNIQIPPSLKNIYKELQSDLGIERKNGCLVDWAKQGILLLNTSLTVIQNEPESHLSIWNRFTESIIQLINTKCEKVVFFLWGRKALKYKPFITNNKHCILVSAHPSPLSVTKFYGNKHFSQCNDFLGSENGINW